MNLNLWRCRGFVLLALGALGATGAACAQGAGLTVSAGLKAWNTQWTSFGYYPGEENVPAVAITQTAARDKQVLLPSVTLRYQDYVASLSAYLSSRHDFVGGGANQRRELDINGGYVVLPGLALTLGYKRLAQVEVGGDNRYELGGPVAGVNASAPINGSVSIYGALGFGKLKPVGSGNVDFDADYRLTEVGLAYTMPVERWFRALTFTAGYRTQALTSKRAFDLTGQDGRDLTQGLTLGVSTTF